MTDGHIHSINQGEDGNLAGLLHRVIDLEEADKETMHLLIFLFLQFLSRVEQVYIYIKQSYNLYIIELKYFKAIRFYLCQIEIFLCLSLSLSFNAHFGLYLPKV